MLHAAGGVQRAVLLFYRRSPLGRVGQEYAVIATTIGMFLTETVLFASALLLSALPKTYRGAVRLGAGMLTFSMRLISPPGIHPGAELYNAAEIF